MAPPIAERRFALEFPKGPVPCKAECSALSALSALFVLQNAIAAEGFEAS